MGKTKLFASTGKPILHSLSPAMYNAAFKAVGADAVYTRLAAESADEALATAKEIGMAGLNITSPFKEDFAALAASLDRSAGAIGAVNTLLIGRGGRTRGFNTDSLGVSGALRAAGAKLKGCQAVVLGAGGAARAAVHALSSCGADVLVGNRTEEKARGMAREFGCGYFPLDTRSMEKALGNAGVIVSALSTTQRVVPAFLLRKGTVVLDAVYAHSTAISLDAAEAGCTVIGGNEWLAFQGAAAFEIFTGKKPPLAAMRRAVERGIAGAKRKSNLALIGFMGSGKTSTAREIAKSTGMLFVETDDGAEKAAGMRIRKIFEKHGERRFRKLERAEIGRLAGAENAVVACGGGAVLDRRNVRAIRQSCHTAWLWASTGEVLKRIGSDVSRPLLNVKGRRNAAEKILSQRIPLYASCADIVVNTQGRTPAEVSGLIRDEVNKAFGD